MIIAPSLLSADFSILKEEVLAVEQAGADWLHLDVMDGQFVPNLTFGPPVIEKLRPHSKLFFDAHLMVLNPLGLLKAYKKAGVDQITVHIETLENPANDLQTIADAGFKVGLTLKPSTNVSAIQPYIPFVDNILVMTVEPGFGGQSFMHEQIGKIKLLHKLIQSVDKPITLQVDGGINKKTISLCAQAGADIFVAGNAIFNGDQQNYGQNIKNLKKALLV